MRRRDVSEKRHDGRGFHVPRFAGRGEELLRWDSKSYMGGFVKVAREHDGVELTGIESPSLAEDRHRVRLDYPRGLREIPRQDDLRDQGGAIIRRRSTLLAWGHGGARRAATRGGTRATGPRSRGTARLYRWDLDPHGNEDEASPSRRHGVRRLRQLPPRRACGADLGSGHQAWCATHATVKVPVISPTVLQWTGASPWMDLVQRALTWEAREPDAYVNLSSASPGPMCRTWG